MTPLKPMGTDNCDSQSPNGVRLSTVSFGSLWGIRGEVRSAAALVLVSAVWSSVCKSDGSFLRRFESCTCHISASPG